ncbi:MAG: hypothetical protein AAGA87_09835 [Pseudomonadota bacterium]
MAATEPLGVGNIISESFSIFFKRIVQILIIGFVMMLASQLINLVAFGPEFMTGMAAEEAITNPGAYWTKTGISSLIGLVFTGIMFGAFTLLAYDAKLGRSARLGAYFSAAIKNLLPIAILTLIVAIIVYLGLALLIVPGLWLMGVFCVIVPAIVVENAGFGALGRSASLTKGYRWPIIGLWLVFIIIALIFFAIIGGIVGVVVFASIDAAGGGVPNISTGALVIFLMLTAVLSGLMYGLLSIPAALVYARLREIKEGISVDSMADVFA